MSLKSFYKWEKAEPGSAEQCQAVRHGSHQCIYKKLPGSNYCLKHHGCYFKKDKENRMKNYQLTKFKARTQRLSESENILALNDEIAILRMLVEERINRCSDESDLMLMSGPLMDLSIKIEKLVTSMARLQDKSNHNLGRDKIIQFAQIVIEIVSKYVDSEEVLDSIGDEILESIKTVSEIE